MKDRCDLRVFKYVINRYGRVGLDKLASGLNLAIASRAVCFNLYVWDQDVFKVLQCLMVEGFLSYYGMVGFDMCVVYLKYTKEGDPLMKGIRFYYYKDWIKVSSRRLMLRNEMLKWQVACLKGEGGSGCLGLYKLKSVNE